MRNQNNSCSVDNDILEVQSAPPDAQDFDERNKLEEDLDEDQLNEEEEEEIEQQQQATTFQTEKNFEDEIPLIDLEKSQSSKANFWGNDGEGNDLEIQEDEGIEKIEPSSSSIPQFEEEDKQKQILQNFNQRRLLKRPRLDNRDNTISFTANIPTPSYKGFLQKQREIRQLCRQIGPSSCLYSLFCLFKLTKDLYNYLNR